MSVHGIICPFGCGMLSVYPAIKDNLNAVVAYYAVHLIDVHWELVERVHATTGNPQARSELNEQLAREMGITS